jgi:hypothetical protein
VSHLPNPLPTAPVFQIERNFESSTVQTRGVSILPSLSRGLSAVIDAEDLAIPELLDFFVEYPEIGNYFTQEASIALDAQRKQYVLRARLRAFLNNCAHGRNLELIEDGFEENFNALADELVSPTQRRLISLPIVNGLCRVPYHCDSWLRLEPFTDANVLATTSFFDQSISAVGSCYAQAIGVYEGEKDFSLGNYPTYLLDRIRASIRIGASLGVRFLWAEERIDSVLATERAYAGGGRRTEPSVLQGDRTVLDDEKFNSISHVWTAMSDSANANLIATAARRLNYGVEREREEDAITDFVAGMESILTSGDFGEISFKLRLRLAALIGLNAEDRKNIFRTAGKIYDARSALSHGRDSKNSNEMIHVAKEYLGRLILAVLDRPRKVSLSDLDFSIIGGLQSTAHSDSEAYSDGEAHSI